MLALLFMATTTTSCVKGVKNPANTAGTSLKEVIAPATFNWQSVTVITIKVTPMPPTSNRAMALEIRSDEGALLFVQQLTMHQALEQQISVPAGTTMVQMSYGNIKKSIDVVNGIANIDYTLPIPTQYQ